MDDIITWILNALQNILYYLGVALEVLGEIIAYIAAALYSAVVATINFIIGLVKILVSALGHVIHDILSINFKTLWDDVLKVRDFLNQYISQALKAMRAEQAMLQHLFNLYLGPVLNFLQDIRKVLAVFRALGFKWAAQLDTYLATIEGKITGTFQKILQGMNRHADLFSLLVDPTGFLRIVPLIHAAALAAENMYRLFTGRTMAWHRGQPVAGGPQQLPMMQQAAAFQQVQSDTVNDAGDAMAVKDSMAMLAAMTAAEIGN